MPASKKTVKKSPKAPAAKEAVKKEEEIEEVKKSLFEENKELVSAANSPQKEKTIPADLDNHIASDNETKSDTKQEEVEVAADVRVEQTPSSILKNIIPAGIGFITGIVTTSLFMYYYSLQTRETNQFQSPAPTATVMPTITSAASASASLTEDLALYDITVLNGSGKGGEAAKLEKELKSEGFAVLEIGNADKSDYKKTIIKTKSKVPGIFLDKLTSYLKTRFDLEDKIETLSESEKTDVVIIVGSLTSAQSTPSATITAKPTP